MTTLNFKLNKNIIRLTVNNYCDNLSVDSMYGILISGYISNNTFYLQTISPEIRFFEADLIKAVVKSYNKENSVKIKLATF